MLPQTSIDAHASLDEDREADWHKRITRALLDDPRSAAWLAEDLGESYHDLERRCSTLKRKGVLRFGERVKNPSGRWAFRLVVTPEGEEWLRTGREPSPPPRKRDLELAVIKAAREALTGDDAALRAALAALDAHGKKPTREAGRVVQAGSERTRWLAERGFHVGSDGVPVLASTLPVPHLLNADAKLDAMGVAASEPERRVLQEALQGSP